jgi:hypothetical protein
LVVTNATQSDRIHGQGAQGLDGAFAMGNGMTARSVAMLRC